MNTILIFALPVFGTVLLAAAGMIYSGQKVTSIWIFFFSVVLYALAVCLYWQQHVITNEQNPPFVIRIGTALVGESRDTQFHSEYGNGYLSPIPVALSLTVTNNQDVPATVESMKIDVKLKEGRWIFPPKWIKTTFIPPTGNFVWIYPPPQPPRRIEFADPSLQSIIEKRALQPHETVRGWVVLDASKDFDAVIRPVSFRIEVEDTIGRSAMVIASPPQNTNWFGKPFMVKTGDIVDISGFVVRHFIDRTN